METKHSNEQMPINATPTTNALLDEDSFSVYSYSMLNIGNEHKWVHWSKGLKMVITKNGKTTELEEDEIRQLVKCLPRTFGGSY